MLKTEKDYKYDKNRGYNFCVIYVTKYIIYRARYLKCYKNGDIEY